MRLFISFSPSAGLAVLWDDGQGLPSGINQGAGVVTELPVSKPALPASPTPLHALTRSEFERRSLRFDYTPNRKAVRCAKCHQMIAKGSGYQQIVPGGFYCEYCQSEAGQPTRPIVEVVP